MVYFVFQNIWYVAKALINELVMFSVLCYVVFWQNCAFFTVLPPDCPLFPLLPPSRNIYLSVFVISHVLPFKQVVNQSVQMNTTQVIMINVKVLQLLLFSGKLARKSTNLVFGPAIRQKLVKSKNFFRL